ncbi:MAG: hypothetical protein HQK79_12970 [Desulfobacterales bacterium]|nr:hypothetical protein [Desulfobacterales bacterium]
MVIATHQIHNVLKVYSRQLKNNSLLGKEKETLGEQNFTDRINISLEGKRQAILNKVASDIVEKITRIDSDDKSLNEGKDNINKDIKVEENQQFVFNIIDNKDQKKKTALSLENSNLFAKRVEDLYTEREII